MTGAGRFSAATPTLLFVAAAALGAALTLRLTFSAAESVEAAPLTLDMAVALHGLMLDTAAAPKHAHAARLVLMADSMAVGYAPEDQLNIRLKEVVKHRAPGDLAIDVRSLATLGMTPFDYYFLADFVAATEPDIVLYGLNLSTFGAPTRQTLSKPEFAAFVHPRRVGEALAMPIYWAGLTADRLLFYVAMIRGRLLDRWMATRRSQAQVDTAFRALHVSTGNGLGTDPFETLERAGRRRLLGEWRVNGVKPRLSLAGIEAQFGPALHGIASDHPVLAALGATVKILAERGATVLVYVHPINIDHFRTMAALDQAGLAETIRSARSVVLDAGGDLLDLHALFPDDMFGDASGHFSCEVDRHGPQSLAEHLHPYILQAARQRPRLDTP